MAIKNIAQRAVPSGTSAVELYTVASGMKARINKFTIINNDSSSGIVISVHIVPNGNSAAADNAIVLDFPLAAQQTKTIGDLIGHLLTDQAGLYVKTDTANKATFVAALVEFVD